VSAAVIPANGFALYYDDDHLNVSGAGLFGKDFKRLLIE